MIFHLFLASIFFCWTDGRRGDGDYDECKERIIFRPAVAAVAAEATITGETFLRRPVRNSLFVGCFSVPGCILLEFKARKLAIYHGRGRGDLCSRGRGEDEGNKNGRI